MRDTFLPLSPPSIGSDEIAEVVDTLKSGWLTTGPKTARFEEEFASFVGAPAALGLSSCTAAFHVALTALGVGPGDAVVTTPLTFASCTHVIEHVGAIPVLADVEPAALTIDPERAEREIERLEGASVRAIMPVHLYGHPCDLDALLRIAEDRNLAIIEDAAHALPASYRGRMVGSLGASAPVPVLTAFSFYVTKNLATGEGGMLTGPTSLVEEARTWSLHGMNRDAWQRYTDRGSWYYEVVRPGFKYNMTDIAASLGIHQLRRLPELSRRRREIVARYQAVFGSLDAVEIPIERPGVEHAWHLYVLRLRPERFRWYDADDPAAVRARFVEELRARNIGSSVHFIPIHLHPYYRDRYGYKPEDFPNAFHAYQRIVSLPLFPAMSDRDTEDVIEAVADIIERNRR